MTFFALKVPEGAKLAKISGCQLDWTCSKRYVVIVPVKKDACFGFNLTLRTIFKIYGQFSENAIFKKIVNILNLQKLNFSSTCFTVWCTILTTCTQWTDWKSGWRKYQKTFERISDGLFLSASIPHRMYWVTWVTCNDFLFCSML